jgi:hypothetical protein
MKLKTPKEVMRAFLEGRKIINFLYPSSVTGDFYLYLSCAGFICEEDGATVKECNIDFSFRGNDPEWETVNDSEFDPPRHVKQLRDLVNDINDEQLNFYEIRESLQEILKSMED